MSSIFLVEDEGITAIQLKKKLQKLGYEVPVLTANAETAIQEALKNPPDLILMDINLDSAMDGITATERITTKSDVPVVFVTAYGDEKSRRRMRESGAAGLVHKPVDWDKMEGLLSQLIAEENDIDQDLEENLFFGWKRTALEALAACFRFRVPSRR